MIKKVVLLLVCLLLVSGCSTQEEDIKNEYIALKNEMLNEKNYVSMSLPVDIITTVERIDEEDVNYKTVITNPKENMHDVKVILLHNYYSEDVFPSIGIFNESEELLMGSEVESELVLEDTIKTTKNISKLGLELKLLIEYTDDNGEIKDIYYKTT